MRRHRCVTKEQIRDIYAMYKSGKYFIREIAEKFDISIDTVHVILREKRGEWY